MNSETHIAVLNNGLRVVARPANGLVGYIGVAVGAGSRDEEPSRQGLAHFVEHTIFKGTLSRKSWHISNRMESIGGELNAYTSKEETLIYTSSPAGNAARALELLGDLVKNSIFPTEELEKEREVVTEEIYSYLDSPSDAVYDDFEELIYAGSGLAHNILGSPESVKSLTGADCRSFLDHFYTPANMVVYAVDSTPPERIFRLAEKYFGSLRFPTAPSTRTLPPPDSIFHKRRDKGNHQANTLMGVRLFGRHDERRFPLFLFNNYLGGPCMNSRLNREMRERRGLVYTVDSSVSLLSDTGLLSVYFGSDPAQTDTCRAIVDREIRKLADARLPEKKFETVKRQYCGQLLLTSDHKESRAMALAKSLLYYGEIHDIETTAQRISDVTAEEFRDIAVMIADKGLSSLTLV